MSERTVWRWLAEASRSPRAALCPGERSSDRFEITREIRVLLAYWHGNASAVHRRLVARAETGPHGTDGQPTPAPESAALPAGARPTAVPLLNPVPSLSTFLRAVRRDLTAGERAGLASGPDAARAHDVFGERAASWRNHVGETDHVQAPLPVNADGDLVRPWATWFIDTPSPAPQSLPAFFPAPPCWPRCAPQCCVRSLTARQEGHRSGCEWTGARTSCPPPSLPRSARWA